jgi:hypothetical protein
MAGTFTARSKCRVATSAGFAPKSKRRRQDAADQCGRLDAQSTLPVGAKFAAILAATSHGAAVALSRSSGLPIAYHHRLDEPKRKV